MACATRSIRVSAVTPVRLALLVALLVATACAPGVPLVSPTVSPSPSPVPAGGVLRVAVASDVTTLDPWAASDAATLATLRQVYEPLVDLAPGSVRVVPKLAERWEMAADGRTYRFTLRTGVRFHDGASLYAAAVVFSFERARPIAPSDLGARIASVTAADASTVVFTLREPYGPFIATLASPSFSIVSPGCVRADPGWATVASRCSAGTGPFRIDPGAWQPGQQVVLTRNTSYWGRDAGGHALPYLDGVTFRVMPDDASRASAVHAANADVALDLGPAGVAQLRSDPNIAVVRRPTYDASFLGFAAAGPFGSSDVRRAVAMAIDRGAIAQTVYAGDAKVATQLVPPGVLGYDASIAEFVKYDVTAAKKVQSDAGQGAGFSTELWYPTAATPSLPDPKRVAEAIAADLTKIGIAVTLRTEDAARLAADAAAGALPLWIASRVATRADADDFLADVTNDPVVQALLQHARSESDESKRGELYKQVTKLVQQQTARVPLFNASLPVAASRKVHDLVPQPVVGESFAAVWLGR